MRRFHTLIWAMTVAALVLALAPVALAEGNCCPDLGEGQLAELDQGRSSLLWRVFAEHARVRLTVSTPCGVFDRVYDKGEDPFFDIRELAPDDPNGSYTWQIRVDPIVDPSVAKALKEARLSGDDEIVKELRRKGLLPAGPFVQSGAFSVVDGAIVDPNQGGEKEGSTVRQVADDNVRRVTAADIVHNDDVIIHNSLCVGFDCVNNETFNADTIRLKENNLRIHVDDTSSVAGFPNQDWRLEFNSQNSGGGEYFRVIDVTASRNIMTLEANAPSNSLVVDDAGRMGLGTANPVVELHIANGDTPTLRLEQTTASGFAAQTWDIAGNETNFFVRDVTGGSTLPFRIFPGAASSTLVIDDTDNVGIGTTSPDSKLDIESSGDTAFRLTRTGGTGTTFLMTVTDNNAFFGTSTNDVMAFTTNGSERMRINATGRVAIGCTNPSGDFDVQSTSDAVTNCGTAPFSSLTAGNTTFTASSSRTIKENLTPIRAQGILDKVAGIDVYEYDFIGGPQDVIGLMAEDFHTVFSRGSDKMLNGQEVQMALWLAVKELVETNRQLKDRVTTLEAVVEAAGSQDGALPPSGE